MICLMTSIYELHILNIINLRYPLKSRVLRAFLGLRCTTRFPMETPDNFSLIVKWSIKNEFQNQAFCVLKNTILALVRFSYWLAKPLKVNDS